MFNSPYKFDYLGEKKTFNTNPICKAEYRFKAACRRYFVTIEVFSFRLVAVKYCDVRDKDSKNAFSKIFNDHDSFRVIATCLHIMFEYWRKNPLVSFAFYAVPREWKEEYLKSSKLTEKQILKFEERYKKVRFTIYKYAMLNLFSSMDFQHLIDNNTCLYVLINKKESNPTELIKSLGEYLTENCDFLFEPGSDER